MTLDALIILAGTLVAVLPFLGFPHEWDSVLFFLAGVLVITLGIVVRRRGSSNDRAPRAGQPFVDAAPREDKDVNASA